MSHFSVLVIGPDVEGQLAPFQENNMGDCPKKYLQFNDITEESLKDYNEDTADRFVDPDGKSYSKYEDRFSQRKPGDIFASSEYVCPAGWTEAKVPVKDLYSFDEYMTEYCGNKKDDVLGRYGYWENPNAKWDWFRVGGRWAGHFKLKEGATAPAPKPGYEVAFGQEVPEDGRADVVRKRDVDFEGMRNDAEAKAVTQYDFVAKMFSGLPVNASWEEVREDAQYNGDIEKARAAYWDQARCVAWKAIKRESLESVGLDSFFDSPDDFMVSREQYIQSARDGAFSTFAVVKDGKWYEKGKMGWFAYVADEKDPETWRSMFAKLIDGLPDDTQLTVVDCHI